MREISSQLPRLQRKHLELKTTEGRPRKHYYSDRTDSAEVAAVESEGAASMTDASTLKIDEHALYPMLSQYLPYLTGFVIHCEIVEEELAA